MWRLIGAGLCAMVLQAVIVDRLAITVGQQSITELQLEEELRVTALLNREPVSRTDAARKLAADRLIQQLLIEREMDLTRYTPPTEKETDGYIQHVEAEFGPPAQLQALLARYQLTQRTLEQHLKRQLSILRFVEYRFQPESEAGVDGGVATEEKPANDALSAWLEQARRQMEIVYIDKSLR